MKKYILNSAVGILCGIIAGFVLYSLLTKEKLEWSILLGLIVGVVMVVFVRNVSVKKLYSKWFWVLLKYQGGNLVIKKVMVFFTLSLVLLLPFNNIQSGVSASEKFECQGGDCIAKPESNVTQKEFNNILKEVKKTEEYKKLSEETAINTLSKKDIIINKEDHRVAVSFIIGEKVRNDNLAYVELLYDLNKKKVETYKLLYGEEKDDGLLNIRMEVSGEELFSMDINEKGEIIENGQVISQESFYEKVVGVQDGYTPYGWCEWAVGALCGAGGGAGCYALALALGITTGIGGFSLATVCGLIGALGCTAATKKICG